MEHGLRRNLVRVGDQRSRAAPANFDSAEQVGLRARHLEDARRIEAGVLAEDQRVGPEAHLGAATVRRLADDGQRRGRLAALECLAIERLAARDLDFQRFRQRVDDGDADAMQAAGRLVGAAVELAAGVQHRHDHFERRLLRELRMRIDRHAAAVVEHAEPAAVFQRNLDEGCVTGDRLVHRIVDHLGEQMMQRIGVGAADIHARSTADRLEPLEHLDRRRVVVRFAGRAAAGGLAFYRLGLAARRGAEEVIHQAFCGFSDSGASR